MKRERRLSSMQILSHTEQVKGNCMLIVIKTLHKNIHWIFILRDISHRQLILSNNISDEMIMHVEVFCVSMKNRILDSFQSVFWIWIDHENWRSNWWFWIIKYMKIIAKLMESENFFDCMRQCDDLWFHYRLCDERLLLE